MSRSRLLWSLVLVGALCALAALVTRIRVERHSRSVDLVVDWYALLDFCQAEGLEPEDTLGRLKAAGATAVAYPEVTLDHLVGSGQIAAYDGADFSRALRAGAEPGLPRSLAREPDPSRTYLVIYSPQALADLETFLPIILGPGRYSRWPQAAPSRAPAPARSEPVVLEISTSLRVLSAGGLGFSRNELQAAQKQGLNVYLRPQNRPRFQEGDVNRFFAAMAALRPIKGIIFEGMSNEVVGYPDNLDATVKAMQAEKLLFGNIEVPTVEAAQKGSQTLGRRLDDLTVRVFSLSPQQQAKMTPDDVIDRYRLGTRERNMRVLYLRFFAAPESGKSVVDTNLDYVKSLRDTLRDSGFHFEGARPFPDIAPWLPLLIGMTLGATAAGILFLELFVPLSPGWTRAFLMVLPLMALAAALLHRGSTVSTLMALESAFAFSVLGLAYGLPMLMRDSLEAESPLIALRSAVLPLVLVTLVSLLGGLYMAGFMSSTAFMLSVSQFRGIKLIMVCAPAIVVILYLTRFAPERETLAALLNKRVVFWHVLAFGALAVVGLFYIARTGNASPAAASDYERYVRDFLESTLVVRPRFKEFALGHPAWFVLAALLYRRRGMVGSWLLVLCVAIGQVDVVDTFAHAHTPYLISLARAFIGLGLGVVIGLIAGWVVARFVREGFPNEVGRSSDEADNALPPPPVRPGRPAADDSLQPR
jgi:hypothetical protein